MSVENMDNRIKIDSVEQIGDIDFDNHTLVDNRNGEENTTIEMQIVLLAEKINFILWYLKNKEGGKR